MDALLHTQVHWPVDLQRDVAKSYVEMDALLHTLVHWPVDLQRDVATEFVYKSTFQSYIVYVHRTPPVSRSVIAPPAGTDLNWRHLPLDSYYFVG